MCNRWKRTGAVLLSLTMCMGLMPSMAFAAEEEEEETFESEFELTDEEISEFSTSDPEGSEKIDAAQDPYGEDDTWAIYVYMVGADLESNEVYELSEVTSYLVYDEAVEQSNLPTETMKDYLTRFVSELDEQDIDLPDYLYLPSSTEADTEDEDTSEDEDTEEEDTEEDIYEEEDTDEDAEEDTEEDTDIDEDENLGEDEDVDEDDYGILGCASADLDEMTANELPENISLVIQTGGATAWENGYVNPNRSQRFVCDSEGFREVEDNHIEDMGDPETLSEFLTFCSENYPADHVMLLFWDHGAGTFGFGVDEIYGSDRLTLSETKEALSTVYEADPENPPIDLIGFDACLMASTEVAETLYGYGRYLAASEETEPGLGWQHDQWIADLIDNPQMTAAQLGRSITDSYINSYVEQIAYDEKNITSDSVTFSTIDINAAHEVYQAYADLCAAILRDAASDVTALGKISRSANQSIKFAKAIYAVYNTVDLGLMMENLQEDYPDEAGRVLQALDEAVLYHRATDLYAESTGLTIYFPGYINDINGIYNYLTYIYDVCENEDIRALYYYKLAGCLNEELQEYTKEQGYGTPQRLDTSSLRLLQDREITMGEGLTFSFAFEEDEMDLVQDMTLYLLQDADGVTVNLGEDVRLSADDSLVVTSDFDGTWLSFDGNNLETEVIDRTDNMISYRSEVICNDQLAWLILTENTASGKFSVSGVYYESDEEVLGAMADRMTDSLEEGDILQPIYTVIDSNYSVSYVIGDAFEVSSDSEVGYSMLDDGDYYLAINVYDVRGDTYDCPYMHFTVENGEVTSAEPSDMTAVILSD